jgi:hypothetical protein
MRQAANVALTDGVLLVALHAHPLRPVRYRRGHSCDARCNPRCNRGCTTGVLRCSSCDYDCCVPCFELAQRAETAGEELPSAMDPAEPFVAPNAHEPPPSAVALGPRLLVFGDSWVNDPRARATFPAVLGEELGLVVLNLGAYGSESKDLGLQCARIDGAQQPSGSWALVHSGANDIIGSPPMAPQTFCGSILWHDRRTRLVAGAFIVAVLAGVGVSYGAGSRLVALLLLCGIGLIVLAVLAAKRNGADPFERAGEHTLALLDALIKLGVHNFVLVSMPMTSAVPEIADAVRYGDIPGFVGPRFAPICSELHLRALQRVRRHVESHYEATTVIIYDGAEAVDAVVSQPVWGWEDSYHPNEGGHQELGKRLVAVVGTRMMKKFKLQVDQEPEA